MTAFSFNVFYHLVYPGFTFYHFKASYDVNLSNYLKWYDSKFLSPRTSFALFVVLVCLERSV